MAKFTRMSPAQTAPREGSDSNPGDGNRRRNRRRRTNT